MSRAQSQVLPALSENQLNIGNDLKIIGIQIFHVITVVGLGLKIISAFIINLAKDWTKFVQGAD